MKKKAFKRALSAFLAFVMVSLMMPVLAVTVNAAGDSVSINTDYSFSASIRYQTEYRINNRYTMIYNTFNEPEQKTKWQSFTEGVGKAKGIVGTTGNLAINLYTQITGWDSSKEWYENAGKMALNLACSYFGIQLPGPSESDKTIEAVGEMIDGVHQHLNDMESNIINELSDVVRDSDADLAAFMSNTAKEAEWRTYLDAFYGTGSNFNYDAFRDNLNGAIDELNTAYDDYNIALESGNEELIQRRAELIKIKYDNLYYVLNYSISGGNYSPIVEMRKRMTEGFSTEVNDEETFYSIPRILYAYKVVSASNDGMTDTEIAESCIGFALELYYTYLMAEQCLNACYGYQLSNILENNSVSYTAELPVGNSHITDSDIKRGLTTSIDIQKEVTDKVVAEIAFLLNLENSYMYEVGGTGEIYEIPYIEQVSKGAFHADDYPKNYGSFIKDQEYCRINDEVSVGDIIYMNTMPEMFREMFKEGIFTFEIDQWNSKDEKTDASTVTNTGVVNILGNVGDTVIVTMYYNGVECYHMEFKIAERSFSGGMGIKDCPYLISNKDQFENITKYNAAVTLIDNIDFKGASIAPLGTLTGALDGNGFAVYGFTMSVETNAGLFDQVANGASVKNLTLGGIDNEKDYLVTISAGPNYSDELIAGGICAINYGVIENCAIMQTKVYSGRDVNQPTEYKIIGIVGGITGRNYSIIRNCVVEKSLVQTDSKTQKDNHPAKCYAYSGGIAGINEGQIFDCSASNNKIK